MDPDLSRLRDLSFSEKLQLVEALWDDLARTPEALPVPDWQKEQLAKRKASHQSLPQEGLSWEEAKKGIRGEDD